MDEWVISSHNVFIHLRCFLYANAFLWWHCECPPLDHHLLPFRANPKNVVHFTSKSVRIPDQKHECTTIQLSFYVFSVGKIPNKLTELKLITRPATTTTPTPHVHTTAKPRRKQHQNHNHKSAHDTTNRIKEIVLPNNLKENEIVGGGGGGGGEAGSSSNDGE